MYGKIHQYAQTFEKREVNVNFPSETESQDTLLVRKESLWFKIQPLLSENASGNRGTTKPHAQ